MKQTLTFTLLGTGSSGGVPRVGNQWGSCDPQNPKNRRRRCALLVESVSDDAGKTSVLIDAGADLREQLLSSGVQYLDGVLLTHSHADHVFGLDDLRQLALLMRSTIPVHMDSATEAVVMAAFGYIFKQAPNSSFPAFCTHKRINHTDSVKVSGQGGDIEAVPLLAEHGDIHSLGFRIADVAYMPDVKRVTDPRSLQAMQGLEVLILDSLRYTPHPGHMNLEDALAFIDQLQPTRAILTNLHSDLDYETLRSELPAHVTPAYDGLQIVVER